MTQTTTIHGSQISLFSITSSPTAERELERQAELELAAAYHAREAGELKRIRQRDEARAASKGAETSRAALARVPGELELLVLAELERAGPGTAEELGDRLTVSAPSSSAWGPQTMSGVCNRLLRRRRICRARKRPGRSGRMAWVWEIRASDSLPADPSH